MWYVLCFPAQHERTQASLLWVTSGPYIPTAAISITVQCVAHCQLLLVLNLPHEALCFFPSSSLWERQPIVRGGAGWRDRGGKLMKLFDGSPGRRARGEVEWTSAWQWDGWGAREKSSEGERNKQQYGDESGAGGRCQKGVITWRQTDSVARRDVGAASPNHAQRVWLAHNRTARKLTQQKLSHPEMPITAADLCSSHNTICQGHNATVTVKLWQTKGQCVKLVLFSGIVLEPPECQKKILATEGDGRWAEEKNWETSSVSLLAAYQQLSENFQVCVLFHLQHK